MEMSETTTSNDRTAFATASAVVPVMVAGDTQHFDAVPRSAKRGGDVHDEHAPVLPPECNTEVCD